MDRAKVRAKTTIPDGELRIYEREYPFAWLGILAEVAPSSEELIYCHHDRGFALHSMRSPTLTRLYLQCAPDEDLAAWKVANVWINRDDEAVADQKALRAHAPLLLGLPDTDCAG